MQRNRYNTGYRSQLQKVYMINILEDTALWKKEQDAVFLKNREKEKERTFEYINMTMTPSVQVRQLI